MTPICFSIDVLEYYMREPRYDIFYNGIIGKIGLPVESDLSSLPEDDKIHLDVFGTARNAAEDRLIVTYLIYLSRLTPKHQLYWASKMITGVFKVHPEFKRFSNKGKPAEKLSVFEAILLEMDTINNLSIAAYNKIFFREVPKIDFLSRKLTLLIRPTHQEYYGFVLTLDKLLSENIDHAFFDEVFRKDEEGKQRGTIAMLEGWLKTKFASEPPDLDNRIIQPLKRIRKERQYPAHKIQEDEYNRQYFEKHKTLIFDSYFALAYLRNAFSVLPGCAEIEINPFLREAKIYGFI